MGQSNRASCAFCSDQHGNIVFKSGQSSLKITLARKARKLRLVDEQNVDQAVCDHRPKIIAMAVDHKTLARSKSNFAASLTRHINRAAHGFARFLRVPQIAL